VIWLWLLVILALKIPTSLMVYFGWRFGRDSDQVPDVQDDGGSGVNPQADRLHPRSPFPRGPRRGPHGDPPPPPPRRVRRIPPGTRVLGG
jgi:hypothetical protein